MPEVANMFKTNDTMIKKICDLISEDIPKFVLRNKQGHRQLSEHNIFIIAAVIGLTNCMKLIDAADYVKKEFYGIIV
ncbi:hypothetical protein [Lysinibacillus fusiformis]|uniref:hypothetical protein n=1 Tax=Lysinibacillus fusiformis TaxID=28031 RepID=UPI003D0119A0